MRRRRFASFLVLIATLAMLGLAIPPATAACSCAMPGPMATYRDDGQSAVFTGFVEPRDARGYPVTVTRWFQGGGLFESRIWFAAESFSGDGASCGVAPLPVGTEWVFVAYRTEDLYGTGLCSPHAAVATADGQAMLADAIETFGGGQPVGSGPPSASAPPLIDPGALAGVVAPLALVLVVGVGFLLGLVGVLRRTRVDRD
jgi:hypothetical protein